MTEKPSEELELMPVTDASRDEAVKFFRNQVWQFVILAALSATAYALTYFFHAPALIWQALLALSAFFYLKAHAFGFVRALQLHQANIHGYQRLEWHNFMQMQAANHLREHLAQQNPAPTEVVAPAHRPLSMSALRAKT